MDLLIINIIKFRFDVVFVVLGEFKVIDKFFFLFDYLFWVYDYVINLI